MSNFDGVLICCGKRYRGFEFERHFLVKTHPSGGTYCWVETLAHVSKNAEYFPDTPENTLETLKLKNVLGSTM